MSFASATFSYMIKRELLDKNVFTLVEYLEKNESNKEPLEDDEIVELIEKCDDEEISLAMKISAYSGFRIGEVLALRIENINLSEMSIASIIKDTKSKKHTRTNHIHKNLLEPLNKAIQGKKEGLLLFRNEDLKQLTLQKRINTYIRTIVQTKKKTFHSLRSAFAKKIENYNLKDIKILLGHRDNDITVISYLKSDTNWNKKVEMINSISYIS